MENEIDYLQRKAEEEDDARRASEDAAAEAEALAEAMAHDNPIDGLEAATLVAEEARQEYDRAIFRIELKANQEIKKLNATIETLIKDLRKALAEAIVLYADRNGEVWYWQGDGENYIESLTCPVLIEAAALRALLEKTRKDAFRTWPEGGKKE